LSNWQKETWQTFEETSGYVRPERVNKWPNSTTNIWWWWRPVNCVYPDLAVPALTQDKYSFSFLLTIWWSLLLIPLTSVGYNSGLAASAEEWEYSTTWTLNFT